MDNLTELQDVWRSARTDELPKAQEMLQLIKKYRYKKLLGTGAVVVTALLLTGLLLMVIVMYRSKMLSTRVGELFMIAAALVLSVAKMSSLVRYYGLKDRTNKDFIVFLERTRERQLFYFKRTQIVGFAFCAVGLLLYPYEAVHSIPALFLCSYGLLIAYLAFLWLVVRPRVFSRQTKKMQEQIDRFEYLLKQMDI